MASRNLAKKVFMILIVAALLIYSSYPSFTSALLNGNIESNAGNLIDEVVNDVEKIVDENVAENIDNVDEVIDNTNDIEGNIEGNIDNVDEVIEFEEGLLDNSIGNVRENIPNILNEEDKRTISDSKIGFDLVKKNDFVVRGDNELAVSILRVFKDENAEKLDDKIDDMLRGVDLGEKESSFMRVYYNPKNMNDFYFARQSFVSLDLESEKTYGYGEIIVNGELYEIELIEEKLDGIVFAVYKDEKIGKLNLLVREISGEITNWDAKFEFNGNIKDFDITTKSIRLKHR